MFLFDTTWGTNVYGMKLGCFTTVGADGDTRILGATILLHEDETSFEWAFQAFRETFKVEPRVVITDGDPAIAAAIVAVFSPTVRHVLCIYHLSLNFNKHILPLFHGANDPEWRLMLDAFWKLAKQTDERSRSTFNDEFNRMFAFVDTLNFAHNTEKAKKQELAREWLESLRARREKWAYRYTWRWLTLGADSSQVLAACTPFPLVHL